MNTEQRAGRNASAKRGSGAPISREAASFSSCIGEGRNLISTAHPFSLHPKRGTQRCRSQLISSRKPPLKPTTGGQRCSFPTHLLKETFSQIKLLQTPRSDSVSCRSDYENEYDRYPQDYYNRVFDYQRVPSSVPVDPSPIKRPRPSSSSSSSSSTAALRMRRNRESSGSNKTLSPASSIKAKLKMTELLAIKRELTVIKVQIDSLLDRVDKMDRQRKDCSECPRSREPSVSGSPHQGSVSSLERESPEPGEASEDDQLHYHHYYPHRIKQHQSDLEDDL
ncbi:RNA-binding Raly-like protein isoform X2 [Pleuronectes platessa]|nr:RNA-binding Raly-like protein isoform X2 [Pleuronectes platessa]